MKYGFLLEEIDVPADGSPHRTYRAVRAVCRLAQEKEIQLTPAELQLACGLRDRLRGYCDPAAAEATPVESLPLLAAREFVANIRRRLGEKLRQSPQFRKAQETQEFHAKSEKTYM